MMFESSVMGKFEFVRLAALRSAQLIRGCTPRVSMIGKFKLTTTAQHEVAQGKIIGLPREPKLAPGRI